MTSVHHPVDHSVCSLWSDAEARAQQIVHVPHGVAGGGRKTREGAGKLFKNVCQGRREIRLRELRRFLRTCPEISVVTQ